MESLSVHHKIFSQELLKKLSSAGFVLVELNENNHLKYKNSIKDTLSCLTTVGELPDSVFSNVVNQWVENKHIYNPILVVEKCSGKVIAIGTILVELKLIHNGGLVGHIEDIAVNDSHQGKGLGKVLLEYLKNLGVMKGCYKIILDCDEKNVEFYKKCGFSRCGVEMEYRP
ncbi:hypothetical protein QEN19_003915 [Hanseniaspora menglaensis]